MRLLIVEDEAATAAFLRRGLTEEGFAAVVAEDAASATREVEAAYYDLILLDVMLPGEDGFTLCARWREKGLSTPILFLTAKDDIENRVLGLNLGGDDYLVKPFAFEELLARIRALLRRGQGASVAPIIRIGDLILDTVRHQVTRRGNAIPLTTREFSLLLILARNAGKIVSRATLWEQIWSADIPPDSNVVDVYVRYLRNKLGRDPDPIQTVRGEGYMLMPFPTEEEG